MEMANPTPALDVVIKEWTAPLYREVRTIIREVVGGKSAPATLDLFTLSVIGQCVLYVSSRPLVEQLALDLGKQSRRTEKIADHIADFSLAALEAYRQRTPGKPNRALPARAISSR